MKGCTLKIAHDEVLSLLHRGAEEFERGEARTGVTLLLEAQFLLAEVVQQQLSVTDSSPLLSPFVDECTDEAGQAVIASAKATGRYSSVEIFSFRP